MKKTYPRYKLGELDKVIKKIKGKDKEVLEAYLKKCSITASEKKVNKIRKLIAQFYDVTQKPLTEQTKESVDDFLIILNKCDKSNWTKDELKIYIKQFLLFFYEDLKMVENFKAAGKRELNPKITENNLLTQEELEKMVRHAESFKETAYLLVAWQTGARPQELVIMKWRDVNFEDTYADLTLYSSKTKKARTFPVVKETMKALWDWREHYSFTERTQNDYVFPGRWREKPLTTAGVNKFLRRMAKKAGIEKDVWGYLLRHTKATRLYEELPQQIVEKLMGHKNMAGVYAHISSKKAREELLKKVYNIEELTEQDKKEIAELKKQVEQQGKQIDSLMSHGDKAFKLQKKTAKLNQILLKTLSKYDDPELIKAIKGLNSS